MDFIQAILSDETFLDSIPIEILEEFHEYLGFYLIDRDIEELDFND